MGLSPASCSHGSVEQRHSRRDVAPSPGFDLTYKRGQSGGLERSAFKCPLFKPCPVPNTLVAAGGHDFHHSKLRLALKKGLRLPLMWMSYTRRSVRSSAIAL
ncbi:hypothetical protein RRG08_067413 [Elysia crispata]|uniref:Uncharacterized protein n=1 Tax=Elysia crispata TaxID=231223 RepID=A0AAE0YMC4_9GAST|nr:hypothetical protein RRG08_067413 [Elysia crispata]